MGKNCGMPMTNNWKRSLRLTSLPLLKINFNKAQHQLRKPLIAEILTSISTFIFGTYLLIISLLLLEIPKYSVPGLISAICTFSIMIFSIIRIRKLQQLDYQQHSVLQLQKQLYYLEMTKAKLSRGDLVANGIALITILADRPLYRF